METVLGRMLRAVAKLIAAVFSLLFIPTTVVVLLLISADLALLNAGTYKRALAEQEIYAQVPALAAEQLGAMESFIADPCAENPLLCRIDGASPELQACLTDALGVEALEAIGSMRRQPTEAELQLAQPCLDRYGGEPEEDNSESGGEPGDSSGPGGEPMGFLKNLSPADWERLIGTLLPANELQAMTEQGLDQVIAYLVGDVDSAKISVVGLRERLAGQAGRDLVHMLLAAQPTCTAEQKVEVAAAISDDEGSLLRCRPQDDQVGPVTAALQGQLQDLVAGMPDEAVIIKPRSPSAPTRGEGGPFGNDPLAAIRIFHQGVWFSLLLPFGLLVLVAIFGARSRRSWLRWWGLPLLAAGLVTLVLGIAAVPALGWAWVEHVVPRIPPMFSSSLTDLTHALAVSVVGQWARWVMLLSGVVSLLGLGALVGARRLRAKSPEGVAGEAAQP